MFGQANQMMAIMQMGLAEDQNLAIAVKNAISLKNTDEVISIGVDLNKSLIDQLVAFGRKQTEKQAQKQLMNSNGAETEEINAEDDFEF